MRIVLVRHGHPDYVRDCLTPLGHEQAEQAALRLREEGISDIFSSPFGRAFETARHTADLLDLNVKKLDFMREIRWGSADGSEIYHGGHPWDTALYALSLGHSLMEEDWTMEPPFAGNIAMQEAARVAAASDEWLASLGYRREGANYRVIGAHTDRTIALFSHGGSSTALLSRLLNLPFFYLCRAICPDFTAVTVLQLSDETGALTAPMIEYANDSRHIRSGPISFEM